MPDWKSRLVVKVAANGEPDRVISPIDSFQPSFSLSAEPIHSIEQTHIGVLYTPQQISFSMTVKAIGTSAAELTQLALAGKRFTVVLEEQGDAGQWSFRSVVLKDCVITNAAPTAANISGVPTATFSGFSLAASANPA
ncbi:MAG: hypothetical protein U1F43_34165 [Myxococcota bacterium]